MSGCNWDADRIGAYLDGETTGEEARKIREHLEACGECRALLEDFRRMGSALKELEEEAPAGLTAGVMARVRADAPMKTRRRWVRYIRTWGAAAAVLALVLLAGPVIWQGIGNGKSGAADTELNASSKESSALAEAPSAGESGATLYRSAGDAASAGGAAVSAAPTIAPAATSEPAAKAAKKATNESGKTDTQTQGNHAVRTGTDSPPSSSASSEEQSEDTISQNAVNEAGNGQNEITDGEQENMLYGMAALGNGAQAPEPPVEGVFAGILVFWDSLPGELDGAETTPVSDTEEYLILPAADFEALVNSLKESQTDYEYFDQESDTVSADAENGLIILYK